MKKTKKKSKEPNSNKNLRSKRIDKILGIIASIGLILFLPGKHGRVSIYESLVDKPIETSFILIAVAPFILVFIYFSDMIPGRKN